MPGDNLATLQRLCLKFRFSAHLNCVPSCNIFDTIDLTRTGIMQAMSRGENGPAEPHRERVLVKLKNQQGPKQFQTRPVLPGESIEEAITRLEAQSGENLFLNHWPGWFRLKCLDRCAFLFCFTFTQEYVFNGCARCIPVRG